MTDAGGDPACWAARVCAACGMLDERDADARDDICPHCARRPQDDLPPPLPDGPTKPAVGPGTSHQAPAPGPTVDR